MGRRHLRCYCALGLTKWLRKRLSVVIVAWLLPGLVATTNVEVNMHLGFTVNVQSKVGVGVGPGLVKHRSAQAMTW